MAFLYSVKNHCNGHNRQVQYPLYAPQIACHMKLNKSTFCTIIHGSFMLVYLKLMFEAMSRSCSAPEEGEREKYERWRDEVALEL